MFKLLTTVIQSVRTVIVKYETGKFRTVLSTVFKIQNRYFSKSVLKRIIQANYFFEINKVNKRGLYLNALMD